MAYFPAVVFLGKVTGLDLVCGLLAELAWALVFIVLARLAVPPRPAPLQRLRRLTACR